jgi:rubrerythrin
MTQELGLEEALDIAMDAELKASAFYAQAAVEVQDQQGRDLLGRLAAFEQYHYEKLSELYRSLNAEGQFIEYEAQRMSVFEPAVGSTEEQGTLVAGGEAAGSRVRDLEATANILSMAIENEKKAGERYRALEEATSDSTGQDMFRKLANEERMHQRILEDEFFSISNKGVWGWSGLYGE